MNRFKFAGREYVRLSSLKPACQALEHTTHPFDPEFVLESEQVRACLGHDETQSHLWAIDFRTLAYPIVKILENTTPEQLDKANMSATELAQLLWVYRFTHIPDVVSGHWDEPDPYVTRVVCDDYPYQVEGWPKPIYWRHKHFPAYKGGRPEKPKTWSLVTQAGYWAAELLGLPVLREPTQEADDIIAQFARNRNKLPILSYTIWTLDTDLLQLVTNEGTPVRWYNVLDYKRYRDAESALTYWQARHKRAIDNPAKIVDDKVRYGDKSDNIPPKNDLRGIIDLWNPAEQPTSDFGWAVESNHARLSELRKRHHAVAGSLLLSGVSIVL